jgi:hypothetical protein
MLKVPSEAELPKGSSLQKYLDVTGQTLADLKPETRAMIERVGEPLDAIPWGVVLIDHRPPTEAEIAFGLTLEKKAKELLSR